MSNKYYGKYKSQQSAESGIRTNSIRCKILNTIIDINTNAKNIDSNFLMMCQPYIGIFADGAEQWCRKMGLAAPVFNKKKRLIILLLDKGISFLKNLITIILKL